MIQPPKGTTATLNRLARNGGATGPIKAQPEAGKSARKRSRRNFHGRPTEVTFADDRSENLLPRPPVSDRHRSGHDLEVRHLVHVRMPVARRTSSSATLSETAPRKRSHIDEVEPAGPEEVGPCRLFLVAGQTIPGAILALYLGRACEVRYGHGHHEQKS